MGDVTIGLFVIAEINRSHAAFADTAKDAILAQTVQVRWGVVRGPALILRWVGLSTTE